MVDSLRMSKIKTNRVIYRFWHNKSAAGKIGYIGKDNNYPARLNLNNRKREKSTRKLFRALSKYPIKLWKIEILAFGFKTNKSLTKAEIFYIKKFDSKNRGYNCTDGGEGVTGLVHSKATKIKMGRAHKGWKPSKETRKRMSESGKSRVYSEKARKRISESQKGKKLSRKHRDAIKAGLRKAFRERPEIQDKMSAARMGKKLSPETRARMSKAQKGNKKGKGNLGNKLSVEHKRKIREARLGSKASLETRKKMGLAQLARWAKQRKEDGRRAETTNDK